MRENYWLPAAACYLVFLGLSLYGSLTLDHGDFVLWLNARHSTLGDLFFPWITHLGDGIFLALIALLLVFFRSRHGWILALAGVIQAIIALAFKHLIYPDAPRPRRFFKTQEDVMLNFVEGVNVHGSHSFPSGHAMTAFMLAVFLIYFFRQTSVGIIIILLAILAGISRIYILQHFLIDVWVGSLWGVGIGLVMLWWFRHYLSKEPRFR